MNMSPKQNDMTTFLDARSGIFTKDSITTMLSRDTKINDKTVVKDIQSMRDSLDNIYSIGV